MSLPNVCACKGIRTCLLCENYKQQHSSCSKLENIKSYKFCSECNKAWYPGAHNHEHDEGKLQERDCFDFEGVTLLENFITEDEEKLLYAEINKTSWVESQSGRRKQDYGPKVNFKKRKLKMSVFTGLPAFSKDLVDRMQTYDVLKSFKPVELCNLEYSPERGSAIEPHFDDFWIWGDRLVTLNSWSDTCHTMTIDSRPDVEVVITLPRRSLVVVQGPARYLWKHGIKRDDITSKRLATTFRELTPEFLEGGENEALGKELIDIASTYQGMAVGANKTQSG